MRASQPHEHFSIFGSVFIFYLICIKNPFFYTRKCVVYKFYACHLILCCLIAVIPGGKVSCFCSKNPVPVMVSVTRM